MADYATKKDVEEIVGRVVDKVVNKAVDDLSEIIQSFAQATDERFTGVEGTLIKVESRLENAGSALDEVKVSQHKLFDTLDAFLKRLDDIETDNAARDAQIARLERWIEQIAAKSKIKLEY